MGGFAGALGAKLTGGSPIEGFVAGAIGGGLGYGAKLLGGAFFGTGLGGSVGAGVGFFAGILETGSAAAITMAFKVGNFGSLTSTPNAIAIGILALGEGVLGGVGGKIASETGDGLWLDFLLAMGGTFGVGGVDTAQNLAFSILEQAAQSLKVIPILYSRTNP